MRMKFLFALALGLSIAGGPALAQVGPSSTQPGSAGTRNLGKSVNDPGTGDLEAMVPVSTETGTSYSYLASDIQTWVSRSNSGTAMADTFPALTTAGMKNGAVMTVDNTDSIAADTITAGASTTIAGGSTFVLPAGKIVRFVFTTPGANWVPDLGVVGAATSSGILANLGAVPTNTVTLLGVPGNGGTTTWTLYGPTGVVLSGPSTTCPLQTAVTDAFGANSTASGPGYALIVEGGDESTGGASVCDITSTVNFPPMQGSYVLFRDVTLNNAGAMSGGGSMLQFDSMLMTRIDFQGSQVAAGTHPAGAYALDFAPTNHLPQDLAAGIVDQDSSLHASNMNSVEVNLAAGSMNNFHFDIDEWSGGNANSILYVTGTGGNFDANRIDVRHAHSFLATGFVIGAAAPTGGHTFQQNIFNVNGLATDGAGGTVGVDTYGSYDTWSISFPDSAVTTPFDFRVGASNNIITVPYTITALSADVNSGTNNQILRAGSVANGAGVSVAGTSTNDNASAGYVGEYVSSNVASGSAVSLTSDTPTNITSITLSPGDWDVWVNARFTGNASTTVSSMLSSVSTTSAVLSTGPGHLGNVLYSSAFAVFASTDPAVNVGPIRMSIASTTTVYLVSQAHFSTSTAAGYGIIQARRAR